MPDTRFLEHRGCRLAYKVGGTGAPVLFVQGTGLYGDGWGPQVEALADHCQCLTFDNRGMGRSRPPGPETHALAKACRRAGRHCNRDESERLLRELVRGEIAADDERPDCLRAAGPAHPPA